jgi:outer membrane lipoprotein carrier protein
MQIFVLLYFSRFRDEFFPSCLSGLGFLMFIYGFFGKAMKTTTMKKITYGAMICALSVLFSAVPGVQASPALSLQDILDKVQSRYQSLQAYTAFFKQVTTSAASSLTTEASGKLYYQKPRQMRWDYDTPEAQTFVVNNQLAWLYVPVEKQMSLFNAKALMSSPLSRTFFDGVIELKKDFQVELDHKQSNQASAMLVLTPRVEDPNIQNLRLQIDLNSFQLMSLETRDALGNTNRITLESQKDQLALDARLFRLDIPPDTAVLDPEGREIGAAEIQKLKDQIK